MQLMKGQNIQLHSTALDIRLDCPNGGSTTLYAALLGADHRVATGADFVHGDAAPVAGPVSCTATGLHVDLSGVAATIQRVVVLATRSGARLPGLELTVTGPGETSVANFSMPPAGEETAIIVCEVYRRDTQWKLRAVGQGYRDGLAAAAVDFGFDATPARPTPSASAAPPPSAGQVTVPAQIEPPAVPHRDRRNRGLRAPRHSTPDTFRPISPEQPQAPAEPIAAISTERATSSLNSNEPQQHSTTHGASEQSPHIPVLARRTESAERIAQVGAEAVASITALLQRVTASAAFNMPSTQDGMVRIAQELAADRAVLWRAHETVRGEIVRKYHTNAFSNRLPANWHERRQESPATYLDTAEITPTVWLADAAVVAEAVRTAGFRPTSSGRSQQRRELIAAAESVLGEYDGALSAVGQSARDKTAKLFADTFHEFRRRMTVTVTQIVGEYVAAELHSVTPCPPEGAPVWQAVPAAAIAPSPPTRMIFPLGLMRLVQAGVDTELSVPSPPGGRHHHRFTIPLAEATPPIPVLLDLDEAGGIVTDSADVVQNLTLDMLATLPAGRLKIDVVDPAKVGASMNFLYGVGEAGEQIYGQKVWGSHDVGELLTELENHVAFVTQKYLQGTHETLTAYNRAAGEVAEPYRLLLLFDHPNAFTRDGKNFDDEALRRLERLATVGRRAGVLIAATTDSTPTSLEPLATAFTEGTDSALLTRLELPRTIQGGNHAPGGEFDWRLFPYPLPSDETRAEVLAHIERNLAASGETQVEPKRVHDLAVQAMRRAVARGTQTPEVIADPHDTSTWWGSSVDDRIVARFGRMGAADIAELRLDSGGRSSALIGGRTGSGKSVLLHSIILGIALQYSPAEVEFYLIDFKEGVEFKSYATPGLPHAKVVAIETNRDFGISVLDSLDSEIARRASLFKGAGQGQLEIGRYRQSTGERLPRIVLVIDEFHMLLEQDDATSTRAAALLDRIIKQGRAFGVHTILASQSVSGGGMKIKTALQQIPNRLVLASSPQDSEQLLAEGNADAQLLSKPGEGIINDHAGQAEANNRFQCTYWPSELREQLIAQLRDKADAAGFAGRPAVFEGDVAVAAQDYPLDIFRRSERGATLVLPIGAPMSLAPPLAVRLGREPGNNLLVVDPGGLTAIGLQIAALRATDVRVEYVDFAAIEQQAEPMFARLRAAGAQAYHRRKLGDVLDSLLLELAERTELDDYHAPARVLFLIGVHRARELTTDTFDQDTESGRLARVLRHGPEVGLHVIVWADRYASLQRRFDHEGLRQFGFKVLGPASEDDSRTLIDSEVAATLTPNQFAVDDYDNARTDTVRRFADPDLGWLDTVLRRGHDSDG